MTNQSGWTARHRTRRKNEEAEPLIGPLHTEDWHDNRKPMPMRLTKGASVASSKGHVQTGRVAWAIGYRTDGTAAILHIDNRGITWEE